jgi:hypothetical protein
VIPAFQRAIDTKAADPTKSNRKIAEELGVNRRTVDRAIGKSGGVNAPPDDRPTIDKPPKGSLWDDQDDREDEDQTVS